MESKRDDIYYKQKTSQRKEQSAKSRGYTPSKDATGSKVLGSVKKITEQIDSLQLDETQPEQKEQLNTEAPEPQPEMPQPEEAPPTEEAQQTDESVSEEEAPADE